MRLWSLGLILGCALVPGCIRGSDIPDSEEDLRRRNALAEALRVDGGEQVAGPLPPGSAEGPRLESCILPGRLAPGGSFTMHIVLDPADARRTAALRVQLRGAGGHIRLPVGGDGGHRVAVQGRLSAHGDIAAAALFADIVAIDTDGRPGLPVTLPLRVGVGAAGFDAGLRALAAHDGPVEALSFARGPLGPRIATGGDDGVISMWDVETGRRKAVWQAHEHRVFALAFAARDNLLVSGDRDGVLGFWTAERGAEVQSTDAHRDAVRALAMSPDGQLVASGSWDATARIWQVPSGRHVATVQAGERVNDLAFSPDGSQLAVGVGRLLHPGAVLLVDTDGWEITRVIDRLDGAALAGEVTSVRFSADGAQLAVAHGIGNVTLLDVADGSPAVELEGVPDDLIEDAGFLPGQPHVFAGATLGGRLGFWDVRTGELIARRKAAKETFAFAVSGDGEHIALGTRAGEAWVLRFEPEENLP